MKVKHLFFSLLAVAFLSSAIATDKQPVVGKKAPKIETISGRNLISETDQEVKEKIISFWSPKKPASRISNLKLSREYSSENQDKVEFISICTDSDESLMKEVMKLDGTNNSNNYAYSEVSSRVFKDYDVEESPRAFKISIDGRISEIF